MAIQINENKLSPDAQRLLNNAKSKSQFLRDAVEFYTNYINNTSLNNNNNSFEVMKKDIEEIKEMIKNIKSVPVTLADNESCITKKVLNKEEFIVNDNGLSELEKDNIEKMLDNSINNFINI